MIDDIKKAFWATADKLRANMDAAKYKHLVLGLIFVKYISDTFHAKRAELTRRFADSADRQRQKERVFKRVCNVGDEQDTQWNR